MTEWWNALDMFQKVLYCVAVPSTLILIVQTLLVLFGIGHGGEGADFSDTSGLDLDGDGMPDTAAVGDVPDSIGELHGDGAAHDVLNNDGTNLADAGSLRLFTIQTVMAFFCVFGWTAAVMYSSCASSLLSAFVGVVFGVLAMYLIAKLVQQTAKLAANGTYNPRNAIGTEGTVYLTIPANGVGSGKVNVIVQGSLAECDAITDEDEPLVTGDRIRVTDVRRDMLVVERL